MNVSLFSLVFCGNSQMYAMIRSTHRHNESQLTLCFRLSGCLSWAVIQWYVFNVCVCQRVSQTYYACTIYYEHLLSHVSNYILIALTIPRRNPYAFRYVSRGWDKSSECYGFFLAFFFFIFGIVLSVAINAVSLFTHSDTLFPVICLYYYIFPHTQYTHFHSLVSFSLFNRSTHSVCSHIRVLQGKESIFPSKQFRARKHSAPEMTGKAPFIEKKHRPLTSCSIKIPKDSAHIEYIQLQRRYEVGLEELCPGKRWNDRRISFPALHHSQVEQDLFFQLKIEIVPGTFFLEIEWGDETLGPRIFRSTLLRTSTLTLLRVHHNRNCAFANMTTTTNWMFDYEICGYKSL